jgi:hypothetical protein
MDLDFHLLKCSGLLKRNESSKAQKRAKNNMKEWKNKRKIITRKIQNSFLMLQIKKQDEENGTTA